LIELLKDTAIIVGKEVGEWFHTNRQTRPRQGDSIYSVTSWFRHSSKPCPNWSEAKIQIHLYTTYIYQFNCTNHYIDANCTSFSKPYDLISETKFKKFNLKT